VDDAGVSKRFKLREVWGEQALPGLKADGFADNKLPSVLGDVAAMGYTPDSTLVRRAVCATREQEGGLARPHCQGPRQRHRGKALGENWFPEKRCSTSTGKFTVNYQHDLAPFDVYYGDKVRGLRWPVMPTPGGGWQETKWRFSEGNDPYVKAGEGFNFYGAAFKAIPSGTVDAITDPKPTPCPARPRSSSAPMPRRWNSPTPTTTCG
jgi:nitrate reductase NapA